MLRIVCKTPVSEIASFLRRASDYITECMKQALADLVREADEKARNRGWDESFRDVSGNLRSSIGGAVYDHGKVYFSTEFATVLGGSTGSARGRGMVQGLAGQYSDCVAMTMVAAMDYAEIVEARDSKDVLESTRIWAESVVRQRLEEAKEKAIREINTWKL